MTPAKLQHINQIIQSDFGNHVGKGEVLNTVGGNAISLNCSRLRLLK